MQHLLFSDPKFLGTLVILSISVFWVLVSLLLSRIDILNEQQSYFDCILFPLIELFSLKDNFKFNKDALDFIRTYFYLNGLCGSLCAKKL